MLGTPWILWSIVLFTISGVAFMAKLAPLQRRMLGLARSAADTASFDWVLYRSLTRQWEFWGAVALLAPAIAMVLMVFKPGQ